MALAQKELEEGEVEVEKISRKISQLSEQEEQVKQKYHSIVKDEEVLRLASKTEQLQEQEQLLKKASILAIEKLSSLKSQKISLLDSTEFKSSETFSVSFAMFFDKFI